MWAGVEAGPGSVLMCPSEYVVPAPTTTIAEPISAAAMPATVAYERLAPGGGGYLPTEYMPAGSAACMVPQQMYAQQLPATMAMPGMMPGYTNPQQQNAHVHCSGPPVHAASEKQGKVPYTLPRPLAAPLGFPAINAEYPTLVSAEAEGEVITISAKDASRWRLELKDFGTELTPGWERPIDAVADTKTATFRLSDAAGRCRPNEKKNAGLRVRLCTVTTAGETGKWTEWKAVTIKKPKEPPKEPPKEELPAQPVDKPPAQGSAGGTAPDKGTIADASAVPEAQPSSSAVPPPTPAPAAEPPAAPPSTDASLDPFRGLSREQVDEKLAAAGLSGLAPTIWGMLHPS